MWLISLVQVPPGEDLPKIPFFFPAKFASHGNAFLYSTQSQKKIRGV